MAYPERQIAGAQVAEPGSDRGAAPLSGRKIARTRHRLVCAIGDEIRESGGFTADLVARRAESSTATFYNHFASKEEALLAVYSTVMEDLVRFVREQLEVERLLELGLQRFVADWTLAVAGFFREHSGVFRVAQAKLPGSSDLRDVYRLHEAQAFDAYRRFVSLGQAASVFRAGNANAIAQVLLVTSEGWNHPSVIRMQAGDPLHKALVASVVRMLTVDERGHSDDSDPSEQRAGAPPVQPAEEKA